MPTAGARSLWYICGSQAASQPQISAMSSYDYIKQLLIEKHDVKPEAITPETKLTELGLDSLSIAELLFDVADKYDIDIPDERATFTTLGEGATLVDELIQAKGA
jgi:acyl carrier protein